MDLQGITEDIRNTCRSCLTERKNMKSLLDNTEEIKKLITKLNSITNIETLLDPNYPAYICNVCEEKATAFYDFQQQSKLSNSIACMGFSSQKEIKVEDNSSYYGEFVDYLTKTLEPNEVPTINSVQKDSEHDIDQNIKDGLSDTKFETLLTPKMEMDDDSFESGMLENNSDKIDDPKSTTLNEDETFSQVCEDGLFHTLDGVYKCRLCEVKTGIKRDILMHVRKHTGARIYFCNICGKQCMNKSMLIVHEDMHSTYDKRHADGINVEENNSEILSAINTENNIIHFDSNGDIVANELNVKSEGDINDEKVFTKLEPPTKEGKKIYPKDDIDKAIAIITKKYCFTECLGCKFVALNNRSLTNHMKNHGNLRGKWCSLCNQLFDDLQTHKNPEHFNHYECPLCKIYLCNKLTLLRQHIYSHLDNNRYTCNICGKRLKSAATLNEHQCYRLSNYTNINNDSFSADITSFRENNDDVNLESINNIKIEEVWEDTNKENTILDVQESCSQTNEDEMRNVCEPNENRSIVKRRRRKYKNPKWSNPERCGKIVKKGTRVQLFSKEGVAQVATMIKNKYLHVNCIHCHYEAVSYRGLSRHMSFAHRELSLRWCSLCNQMFDDLILHSSQVHVDPFKCPFCGVKSALLSDLIRHVNFHSDERCFKCYICSSTFRKIGSLKMHVVRKHIPAKRTNSGQRDNSHGAAVPFVCNICGKNLFNFTRLAVHMFLHKGRPLQCNICEKRFDQFRILQYHMDSHKDDEDSNNYRRRKNRFFLRYNGSDDNPRKYTYWTGKELKTLNIAFAENIKNGHNPPTEIVREFIRKTNSKRSVLVIKAKIQYLSKRVNKDN